MKATVVVCIGAGKDECDDTAVINKEIVNNNAVTYESTDFFNVGVADGVGGNKGGKEASEFVTRALLSISADSAEALKQEITRVNYELIQYSSTIPGKENMATTLTYLTICNDTLYLVHIGNTRLYVSRGAYLKQVTEDQTTYQWLKKRGQFDAAQACNKNEITACLGGGNERLGNDISIIPIRKDPLPKCMLLTSDGVHEYVDIDSLEKEIQKDLDDKEIINNVLRIAEDNGSKDDKTMMIVRF